MFLNIILINLSRKKSETIYSPLILLIHLKSPLSSSPSIQGEYASFNESFITKISLQSTFCLKKQNLDLDSILKYFEQLTSDSIFLISLQRFFANMVTVSLLLY
jgi:hypothetical protein